MRRQAILVGVAMLTAAVAASAWAGQPRRRRPKPILPMPGTTILTEDFEKGIEGWRSRPAGELKRVDDAKAAHRGRGCLLGSVDGDRKANFFEREMEFSNTSIYRFACWARSSHPDGKLVLWRQRDKARKMLGSWRFVGKRWRKYQCQFTVPEGGKWMFQVLPPSSHGAAACTMWVDDIELVETKMSPSANLTRGKGYSSEPRLAVDAAGTVWMSWLAFLGGDKKLTGGRDALMAGRLAVDGDAARIADAWPVALPKGSYVLGTTLVADRRGAWLVYACEVKGNWDIYACRLGADGAAPPRRITTDPAVDAWPAAALLGGKLWVAWESNRDGARQAYLSPADAPKPQRLSLSGVNSYSPAIAADGGALWVAWHAYVAGNYDLYGRRLQPDGAAGPIQRLTRDGEVDRHAQLLACGHGVWIAWQREIMTTRFKDKTRAYRIGVVSDRQTWLCRWGDRGLEAATGIAQTILPKGTEMATLAADAQGRIWVTARRGRGQNLGWDSVLQCFAGTQWGEARHLSTQVGWDGRAGIAALPDRVLVAYQVGRTPAFRTAEDSLAATSDICVTSIPLNSAPKPAPPKLETLTEDTDTHWMAALRQQLGEETPTRTIEYKGTKLSLFWGDLHEHTSISICNRWRDTSPEDNIANERDIVRADFTAMTDHGYNFCPALWNRMAKTVRVNHDPGRFVTFLGEEWTSSHEKYSDKYPEGYYGHRNLIFADPYFPRWYNAKDESTPAQIWADLRKRGTNFVHIPHQIADTGNVPTDWGFADKVAQPVAEIFQARQSYEHKGAPRQAARSMDGNFMHDAWARGIVIGVIASPDHGGGQGKAAVYAPEMTREAILDALRARRCYGTTAARIFLDVRVNGHLMGEEIQLRKGEPIVVTAKAIGANDILRIELCRSNQFIYTKPGDGRHAQFTFRDLKPIEGRSYYYVRVQQTDEELAWSSPVWVTRR